MDSLLRIKFWSLAVILSSPFNGLKAQELQEAEAPPVVRIAIYQPPREASEQEHRRMKEAVADQGFARLSDISSNFVLAGSDEQRHILSSAPGMLSNWVEASGRRFSLSPESSTLSKIDIDIPPDSSVALILLTLSGYSVFTFPDSVENGNTGIANLSSTRLAFNIGEQQLLMEPFTSQTLNKPLPRMLFLNLQIAAKDDEDWEMVYSSRIPRSSNRFNLILVHALSNDRFRAKLVPIDLDKAKPADLQDV